ncbi:sugar O-acetyltransferase [Bombilactobacillus folatiphilus]|uniref:Acetyltransferase n=1 Tax=Bombilactobacillus folatiphilus TaxID=2923362 RepID=A0ABY4PAG6_9LACO|nr:sugar O-acetyltransferase [Bombilactobacillus folatiphilus]UQS82531.1 sugar O-acetyltransferase [Bombilactobacillus folatiphilus]
MATDFDYERMLQGKLYRSAQIHPENSSTAGKLIAQQINQVPLDQRQRIVELERQLFNQAGENIYLNPPLYVDYGRHISIGENFYANQNCTLLDVNTITIGDDVLIGPNTSLYTAGHPLEPTVRREGLEFGLPIVIEDNVWLGGSVTVLPGVTIGQNTVIGAGSVVTHDIEANVLAVGNPARVIKRLDTSEMQIWQQRRLEYFQNQK